MNHSHSTFDPADIERRRAAAYRQIPALRQQALEDAAATLGGLWQAVWRRASQTTRSRPARILMEG